MTPKWIAHWLKHAQLLSEMSPCPRGRVGAFIIDARNNPLSAGFNGPPRGACGDLCGGSVCDRDARRVPSGASTEIGCHHAEQNALANALHKGVSVAGCTLIVTTPPCLACARLIHHSGISTVLYGTAPYDLAGAIYLLRNGVSVSPVTEADS
jgi:dCMP deaminase